MIPAIVRAALLPLVRRLNDIDREVGQSDQAILALAKADRTARRLMAAPSISPLLPLRLPPVSRISPLSQVRVSSLPSSGSRQDREFIRR